MHARHDGHRRRSRWLWVAVVLVVVAPPAVWGLRAALRGAEAQAAFFMLRSDNPTDRKLGAWLTAEQRAPAALAFIAEQLAAGREPQADVRESFVYALGHSGDPGYFDLIAERVRSDPSGYVRQAAWLAAARLDAERFAALAAALPPPQGAWDEIGRANAWLYTGDVRGVPALLRWAREGDADQRLVASGALLKGLKPLLEVSGRWPLRSGLRAGDIWPPEFVAEIARRCAGLDLQRIADDTRPHLREAKLVQRNARRVTSARNWIARFLFWL